MQETKQYNEKETQTDRKDIECVNDGSNRSSAESSLTKRLTLDDQRIDTAEISVEYYNQCF